MFDRLRARKEWKFFTVLPKAAAGTRRRVVDCPGPAGPAAGSLRRRDGCPRGRDPARAGFTTPLALVGLSFVLLQILTPVHQAISSNLGDRTATTLDRVSFAYPGSSRLVLQDISLTLPAGSVVAIVGENGAGKTTLVKLLAKMYEPTAFQDFFRFELRARQTVGVGDVPRVDDLPAVSAAVGRAGADDVVEKLAEGLETQLGSTWPGGVEVSFGQWQKLALARGFMRDEPLLLVLDEPTAALDAETEHALFERYAAAARGNGRGAAVGAGNGRITILVSHRFSTVRMADLIVVLDGAKLVEFGSHEQLMAKRGQYAELYGIQAAAYR